MSTCDSTPDATPQCGSKPQGPGTVAINIEARSAVNNDSEATLSTSSGCTLALKSGDLHRGWRRRGPTIAWQVGSTRGCARQLVCNTLLRCMHAVFRSSVGAFGWRVEINRCLQGTQISGLKP